MRIYSKACEYAIRALVEVSMEAEKAVFTARDICEKADIPEAYARKTFQALVQNGFLKAVSGPGGGYCLNRDSRKTTLLEVIHAVDGESGFSDCILGLPICGSEAPCVLHTLWGPMRQNIQNAMASRTLYELAQSVQLAKKSKKPRRKL